jgi:hypothetical protein
METKVAIEGKPLSQEDFKKLEETQKQVEEIDTDQEEGKDMIQSFYFCFEGFCRHKCLIFNCLALLLFSIVISTILAMVLSAVLLGVYGNIQEDIFSPIQKLNIIRKLANGNNASIVPEEKRLQIVSQNDTHVLVIMPCSSSVIDEFGNTFSIKGLYNLNCNESRKFLYINKTRTWRGQKCCDWPGMPDYMDSLRAQRKLVRNDFWKCGLCQNYCITAASCKTEETITMNRCFWEKLSTGVSIYKNNELIDYLSVTLTVGPHQQAPYGYWSHTNNATGRELIFLNTASNNFLEETTESQFSRD